MFIRQYDIPFKGLKTGIHQYNFKLTDRFFDYYNNRDCLEGSVNIDVEMDKRDHLISFYFHFSGYVRVICDRCLEEFNMPVDFESNLFVKFGEEKTEKDVDVIYLERNEHKLNLADYFLESICINLPIKKVHQKDNKGTHPCNQDMIEKLENHKVNENKKTTDPRWNSLKNLISKKESNNN